jgi:aklavinone 12-hydroxylase
VIDGGARAGADRRRRIGRSGQRGISGASYDAERRPIAERVVAEALRLASNRGAEAAQDDQTSDHQRAIELTLGFRYRSSAVLIDDDDPTDAENPYHPTGRPGFRAPHAWLRPGTSTIDLIGGEFVLLAGKPWQADIPVHVIDNKEVLAKLGITATGATLIRPDGVIAWRAPTTPADPARALRDALKTVLAQ